MEPRERIERYFEACSEGTADEIGSHFTVDAAIYDTNIRPIIGRDTIGEMWVKVRERWQGARWHVDTFVGDIDGAAIEWSMTGTDPTSGRAFVFRGSEHYIFDDATSAVTPFADTAPQSCLIAEIRQYWTFDPDQLDTGLLGFAYPGE